MTKHIEPPANKPGDLVKRHRLSTRLWHWTNAVALIFLLMSGLMIFNAHPRLYWGHYGTHSDPAWFEIKGSETRGEMRIGQLRLETTGVLGQWRNKEGKIKTYAFPWWITIPSGYSLAIARNWHFFFAWIMALSLAFYMLVSLYNRHIFKDLHIKRPQWSLLHIWQDMKDHARLRFPTGMAALEYNILQKLSYITVIFIFLPLMIITGLTMSPGFNAIVPWLADLLGGRQSARSLHFIIAFALVGFFLVHMLMVLLSGPINGLRSMVTGNFRLPGKADAMAVLGDKAA